MTPSQRRNFQAVGWADWVQVFITLCLTKVSICLFLLRIVDSRRVVRGMYVLIGFMVLFSSIFVFLFIGICRPLKAYWDVGVNGWCFSNPQIESIIIAQGGMLPASSSNTALLTFPMQSCQSSQIWFVLLCRASFFETYRSTERPRLGCVSSCPWESCGSSPSPRSLEYANRTPALPFAARSAPPCLEQTLIQI